MMSDAVLETEFRNDDSPSGVDSAVSGVHSYGWEGQKVFLRPLSLRVQAVKMNNRRRKPRVPNIQRVFGRDIGPRGYDDPVRVHVIEV